VPCVWSRCGKTSPQGYQRAYCRLSPYAATTHTTSFLPSYGCARHTDFGGDRKISSFSLNCVDDLAFPPAWGAAGTRASLPTARFLGPRAQPPPLRPPKDSHWLPSAPTGFPPGSATMQSGHASPFFLLHGVASTATASPTPSDMWKTLSCESRPLSSAFPPFTTGVPDGTTSYHIPARPWFHDLGPAIPRADPFPDPFHTEDKNIVAFR